MPFKKGQKKIAGRKAGTPNNDTKQLREFLNEVVEENKERFKITLLALPPLEFYNAYTKLLEYCTPKLQRTELTGEDGEPIEQIVKIGGNEIKFN